MSFSRVLLSNRRAYQCDILSGAQTQQEIRKDLQVKSDRDCNYYSWGTWEAEMGKKGCDYEVKRLVMLVNTHRKKKTGPGILEHFATFQVQSGQNRLNPQRIQIAAKWL